MANGKSQNQLGMVLLQRSSKVCKRSLPRPGSTIIPHSGRLAGQRGGRCQSGTCDFPGLHDMCIHELFITCNTTYVQQESSKAKHPQLAFEAQLYRLLVGGGACAVHKTVIKHVDAVCTPFVIIWNRSLPVQHLTLWHTHTPHMTGWIPTIPVVDLAQVVLKFYALCVPHSWYQPRVLVWQLWWLQHVCDGDAGIQS